MQQNRPRLACCVLKHQSLHCLVTLETMTAQDILPLATLANDPLVSRTSAVPDFCQAQDVAQWLAGNSEPFPNEVSLVIKINGITAGCGILKKINWQDKHAEIAYWLGRDFWGQGIASVVAKMLRDYCFEQLECEILYGHYLIKNNMASGKILAKAGFVEDPNRACVGLTGKFKEQLGDDLWTFVWLPKYLWENSQK